MLFNPSKVSASPTVSLFHVTSLPLTVAIFINVLDESNQRSPVEISLTLLGTSDVPYILEPRFPILKLLCEVPLAFRITASSYSPIYTCLAFASLRLGTVKSIWT